MAFLSWFRKKPEPDVNVSERKQKTLQDTAVAATFAEAGEYETARRMIDTDEGKRTILVITGGERFSDKLITYAVDMAQRLDFKIMAVNTTEAPLALPPDKREAATEAFKQKCMDTNASLHEKASAQGIPLTHLTEIGEQDEIIAKLHARYPGMRYVLTEPDPETIRKADNDDVAIPVFDLESFHGASA